MRLLYATPAFLSLLLLFPADVAAATVEPLVVITTYVRQLGAQEALKHEHFEILTNSPVDKLEACKQATVAMARKLSADAEELRALSPEGNLAKMVPAIAKIMVQKAAWELSYGVICTALMPGPQHAKDPAATAADAPKILAAREADDRLLFQAMPILATALLPVGSNARDPGIHLTITRVERASLVAEIDKSFGDRLKNPGTNYIVMSAVILREFLVQRKCSDEI